VALAADSCDRRAGHPVPSAVGAVGDPPALDDGSGPRPFVRADASGAGALRSIREEGRREAEALYRSIQRLPEGRERRELERRAREVRHLTREDGLRAESEAARDRGDEPSARRAERQLELMHEGPQH
jgi:hypothetical protein